MQTGKANVATLIIILAVIVVIVGIIWFVYASRDEATVTTEVTTVTPTPIATPATSVSVTTTPVDVVADTTSLVDVSDGDGSGTATRDFADGVFTHEVIATLPDLPDGEFYEGWLVTTGNTDFFSTGKMIKSGDEYKLTYTSDTDWQDYPLVVITQEKIEDATPEVHILEGNFAEVLSF